MAHEPEAIMVMFRVIGHVQSDVEKFKLFFSRTKAHFIIRNQLLYYDKTITLQIGDNIEKYRKTQINGMDGKSYSLNEIVQMNETPYTFFCSYSMT